MINLFFQSYYEEPEPVPHTASGPRVEPAVCLNCCNLGTKFFYTDKGKIIKIKCFCCQHGHDVNNLYESCESWEQAMEPAPTQRIDVR